jgi:hypothetical protein
MGVEERLAALEAGLLAAEDRLEILNLLNSYGPLVDSGSAAEAAALWVDGGGYNFSGGISGGMRLEAPEQLVSMYQTEGHMELVGTGCSHLTAMPKITVDGDSAIAVGYSFVVLKESDRWYLWRAAVNEWTLVRTADGWRIKERFNRGLEGTKDSHDVMRRVLAI